MGCFKSNSGGSVNIPTVYTSGITKYTTNYISNLNTVQITDMSGSIPSAGASITIAARDVDGNMIPESGGAILRAGIICAFHKLPLPAGDGWGGGSKT